MSQEHAQFLSHAQARRFYDMLGTKLDTQAFYERAALNQLAEHLRMEACRAVVEFGCGTGRMALELFESVLPSDAKYLGLDVSGTMVAIARGRLARWEDRTVLQQTDGQPRCNAPSGSFDRFLCTYVFDLLAEPEIHTVIAEAHRLLVPGGLLGVVSLTNGPTPVSRLVSTAWRNLHALSPWIVGGCRPIVIQHFLPAADWNIEYAQVLTRFGIPSDIVVARRS